MTSKSQQTVALMFADIKGYSKISNDNLYSKLSDIFKQEILGRITDTDVTLLKTAGDGAILLSFTTAPIANAALRLRDEFRTYNWIASGFPHNLEIHIALHLDEVTIERNLSGQVVDVTGNGVITAARIEPMTPPNAVYCSHIFQSLLANSNSTNLKATSKGMMSLAKNYGELLVYELMWHYENSTVGTPKLYQNSKLAIPIPTMGSKFTDKQKTDFLYNAFPQIRIYFENATTQLDEEHSRLEAIIRSITETKFICEIYLDGNLKSRCKIWIGNMMGGFEYICFMMGNFQISEDSGWNDNVGVEVENKQLRLKSQMGTTSYVREFDVQAASTPEQIGEYFWRQLTTPLETR